MTIGGQVNSFAKIDPRYVRLVGRAGTDIKKTVTITREDAFPFSIVEAKARNGREIAFDLKAFNGGGSGGYIITVENRKADPGRYADTLVLTTDSKIKPTLTIPVYGQIIPAASQQPQAKPSKKRYGEG